MFMMYCWSQPAVDLLLPLEDQLLPGTGEIGLGVVAAEGQLADVPEMTLARRGRSKVCEAPPGPPDAQSAASSEEQRHQKQVAGPHRAGTIIAGGDGVEGNTEGRGNPPGLPVQQVRRAKVCLGPHRDQLVLVNSTRRFAARPVAVTLLDTGWSGPYPLAVIRLPSTPLLIRYSRTVVARA